MLGETLSGPSADIPGTWHHLLTVGAFSTCEPLWRRVSACLLAFLLADDMCACSEAQQVQGGPGLWARHRRCLLARSLVLITGCRTSLELVPGPGSHAFSICSKLELETLLGVMQGQDMSKYRLICDKINGRLGPQYQYKM